MSDVEGSTSSTKHTASPQMVTTEDLQDVIEGWKTKFQHLSEVIRAIRLASEKCSAHIDNLQKDSRAREGAQERRIQDIQEGLARFLDRCDPTHLAASARPYESPCAPVMSTPLTQSGAPFRRRPDFDFESPVNRSALTESTSDNRVHHYNERPTHEDDQGNSGDAQRLVSSLTGPAANMLIGMSMGQLDDYAFLVARLSRRYDPPEREEAHRAELHARTRRRSETADEFADNLKNLAQRAYTNADQNMLDNLVVERFREGHGNEELKKHLCLYPSTGLQDLIGACVRFETHVEIGARAHKSNEGLYTVQGNNSSDLSLEEVMGAARKLGFTLRPWVDRQQGNRGFNNNGPNRYQNGREPQQGSRFNQNRNSGARPQNPIRRQTPIGEVKCWTCGKTGHYASDCKTNGPKFAYAPKVFRMNYLQDISDNENDYSEGEQNNSVGND